MGGRPRKPRATTKIAEALHGQASDNIVEVLKAAVDPDEKVPLSTRLKAIDLWLGIEDKDRKMALEEEKADADNMGREELAAAIAKKFTEGPAAEALLAVLNKQRTDAESTAEEIHDAQLVEGTGG